MQVDEESKGAAAASNNLDIGGYENDEEDEREIEEQEKGAADIAFALSEAGRAAAPQGDTTLVICGCLHSQSLAKIMFAANWQEVGTATSTKTSTEKSAAEREPKTILTMYGSGNFYFAMPDLEKMKGDQINPVVNQLFG